ncbi:MAG: Xaa-Pro peptidase family protein [Bacteroidota bacterium]
MNSRIHILQQQLHSHNVDAIFISFLPYLRYESGFTGSAGIGLVKKNISRGKKSPAYFITDGRYSEQIKQQIDGWNITIAPRGVKYILEMQKKNLLADCTRVGFDKSTIPFSEYSSLKKLFPKIKFVPLENLFEQLVSVKDGNELASLQQAISITDKVFDDISRNIEPGIPERELAAEISFLQKLYGGETDAFEPIVASGVQSALPHARPTDKILGNREMLILDFGCTVNGYHSDMTRTIALGKIPQVMKTVYRAVLEAQQKAIEAVRSGIVAKKLDAIARNHIVKKGFGKFFNHSLGHGVGLQIHETPFLKSNSDDILQEGNTITIEPGIYIPGIGGVRIEDIVRVEKDGCKILTQSPKELMVI